MNIFAIIGPIAKLFNNIYDGIRKKRHDALVMAEKENKAYAKVYKKLQSARNAAGDTKLDSNSLRENRNNRD